MKTPDLFSLAAYDYELPQELIAQQPCTPRDHSRLMVVNRESGSIDTMPFFELPKLLRAGDSLIFKKGKGAGSCDSRDSC